MKKMASICAAAVLAASLLAGGAVQAAALSPEEAARTPAVAEENCISGSWKRAASPEITPKLQKLFGQAVEFLVGADYQPEALLATRNTVSGTEYRLLCRMTLTIPDAEEEYVVVTLHKNWLGRAELSAVDDALYPTDLSELLGGWQKPDSPVLTDAAKAAFEQAMDGLVGVDYEPLALLSTQVVAGKSYRILCEARVVYPDAEPYYVVVTVHEDLAGNASILGISDSFINGTSQGEN